VIHSFEIKRRVRQEGKERNKEEKVIRFAENMFPFYSMHRSLI
jgi:hypothetical protein